MKKVLVLSLVLVLGVSLIGMFGCSVSGKNTWYDVDSIPGVVKGKRVTESDFTYCIEERGEEFHDFGKTYYTNKEPSISGNYVTLEDAYVILERLSYYNYDDKELGYPCRHHLKVKISLPFRIIERE